MAGKFKPAEGLADPETEGLADPETEGGGGGTTVAIRGWMGWLPEGPAATTDDGAAPAAT